MCAPYWFLLFLYQIRICCYKLNKMHMHRNNINNLTRIYFIEIDWIISNYKLRSFNIMHLSYMISSCHQRIATEYHLWMISMNLTTMTLKIGTKYGVYHAYYIYRLCIIELLHVCNTFISYYSKKEYFYILIIDSC